MTPGLTKYIHNIIKMLKSAKSLFLDKLEEMNKDIDEIMDMVRILADNTKSERMFVCFLNQIYCPLW